MSIKKNIGKNTLGDSKKMQVDMRTYNRSTHDLSFAWRNTQGVGTLVPCCKLLGLPGDTADIEIDAKVMTHPTVGPLFGSYKLQVDFFVAPIRLYQAMLHNNALNIGMDMAKVKLPQIKQTLSPRTGTNKPAWEPTEDNEFSQISPSCILSYLGLRGYGFNISTSTSKSYTYNATPLLAYLDIFKNYYANKQEENYYFLATSNNINWIDNITYDVGADEVKMEWANYITGGTLTLTGVTEEEALRGYYVFTRKYPNTNVYIERIELSGTEMQQYATLSYANNNSTWTFKTKTSINGALLASQFNYYKGEAGVSIKSANLEELDDLRNALLEAGNTQVIIEGDGNITNGTTPNTNILYFHDMFGGASIDKKGTRFDNQGLLLKTHQSDLFTNWINTEWIEGENGISAITAVSTAGDEFTIDSLNLAKKVYDMLNRIAVSGGTYRDWIETVYTSDYTPHTETPVYEAGMSDEIVFEQVVSNSATADEPLGTLAGRGTLAGNRKGGKLHIKISEPSYIIGICSITPRVDYCQGNEWDMYLETMNDLHKPQLDGIGYQDLLEENAAWWRTNGTNPAYGKTVAWINYMTNYNKTFGNFAKKDNEGFMCLNRYFEPEQGKTYNSPINTSSYINPEDFNFTFAETNLEAQNFWVQLGFGIKMRRVMSAKQIPTL